MTFVQHTSKHDITKLMYDIRDSREHKTKIGSSSSIL